MSMRWIVAMSAVVTATMTFQSTATAQGEEPPTRAEQLFRDAKQLMREARHSEACPMLEESHRLDPGGGTLLTMALCHEAIGKTATAHGEFLAAAELAARDARDDRLTIAQDRSKALEPRLCHLAIRVHERTARLPGLEVRKDGVPLGGDAWEGHVDPGKYTVSAAAPGRKAFTKLVDLSADGARVEVIVPELAEEARAVLRGPRPVAPAPVSPTSEGTSALTIAGVASGGAGLIALGVGTYFGVRALQHQSEADDRCPTEACADQGAIDLNDDARTSADWSTGLLVAGGVTVAAGIVLLVLGETGAAERASAAWVERPFRVRW